MYYLILILALLFQGSGSGFKVENPSYTTTGVVTQIPATNNGEPRFAITGTIFKSSSFSFPFMGIGRLKKSPQDRWCGQCAITWCPKTDEFGGPTEAPPSWWYDVVTADFNLFLQPRNSQDGRSDDIAGEVVIKLNDGRQLKFKVYN